MNPYDPNDALSDKSEEYIPEEALTAIDETSGEFPVDQLKGELRRMGAIITQKSHDSMNVDFVNGEVTSEDSTSIVKFKDPNNEIDAELQLKSDKSSTEYSMGEGINEVLAGYIMEPDVEAPEISNMTESAEVVKQSVPLGSNTEAVPGSLRDVLKVADVPGDVLGTYRDVLETLRDVSGTPGNVLGTPGDVLETPGDVLGAPGDVVTMPEISGDALAKPETPGDVFEIARGVLGTPGDILGTPRDVLGIPGDVLGTPGDVLGIPGDVLTMPDISGDVLTKPEIPADVSSDTVEETHTLQVSKSKEIILLLEEAKTLFDPPEKPGVKIVERVHSELTLSGPKSTAGLELQEIESRLKEMELMKSQDISKQDIRMNQPPPRESYNKPEEIQQEAPPNELDLQHPWSSTENFCDLMFKSGFLPNQTEVSFKPNIQSFLSPTDSCRSHHVDDFMILTRAVQLLESRPSADCVPTSSRGLLGILALQQKLKELHSNKEDLEHRLTKCNTDFMEFIEVLTDKARIVSINSKEVANFVKILNLKVPEMEKITASHTEALEDIKYRFKERNVAKIIELRNQIEFYKSNVDKLGTKIAKIKADNVSIRQEMEKLDLDNVNYKSNFTRKIEEVRANMDNLQSLNKELQKQLELIQNSDLGKNECFKLKVPSLKEEIECISNNIKQVRREKNKYEFENTELRKKLKQLILAKVMEKRASDTKTTA